MKLGLNLELVDFNFFARKITQSQTFETENLVYFQVAEKMERKCRKNALFNRKYSRVVLVS